MSITKQIAQQLRAVHFGGNWTAVNIKAQISDLSWQLINAKIEGFNTLLVLVYHLHYYEAMVSKFLEGGPLDGSDKFSFDHPPIQSKEAWEAFAEKVNSTGEHLANLIEQFPEERLGETFVKEQYGTCYRNFTGIIEHCHYHLGQIVIIKKLLAEIKSHLFTGAPTALLRIYSKCSRPVIGVLLTFQLFYVWCLF